MTRGSTSIGCSSSPLEKIQLQSAFSCLVAGFHHPRSLNATVLFSLSLPAIKFYSIVTWHSFLRNMPPISI